MISDTDSNAFRSPSGINGGKFTKTFFFLSEESDKYKKILLNSGGLSEGHMAKLRGNGGHGLHGLGEIPTLLLTHL